jgi:GT2 family glycosyltransferase
MPTKVIDIEFSSLPEVITGLEAYPRAMVLVRIKGQPVERVYLPTEHGQIFGDALRAAIFRQAGRTFWENYLGELIACPIDQQQVSQIPAVTVAICTRDRPNDLIRCLDALTATLNNDQEILVVDSCSTSPATCEVVKRFPAIRYVREDQPGLDRARNRAIREAKNEFIAFIDDDAVPDPDWLPALARNFGHPNTACVTGLTMPGMLETPAQEAFEDYSTFSRGFEKKVYDWSNIHPIGAGRTGVGNNMALRRSAAMHVGLFDEALDAGTPTCSGGDTEMFARLIAYGYRIVYDPGAVVWHRHRQDWTELRRTIYGYGTGIFAFWTRKLLFEKEWYVAPVALKWLLFEQIPLLARALFHRKGAPPPGIVWLEICGCFAGPWLYIKSLRQKDRDTGGWQTR